MTQDLTRDLQDAVRDAADRRTPLRIQGHDTKDWLGRAVAGEPLAVSGHRGILTYEPQELVLTARCGTPLDEIEATLAAGGQMLPFEPPYFATGAGAPAPTLGGTIACGLSGPARPYAGAARDLVLGARVLNGRGEVLRFGGEVMKNVAGYDISRLMVGAMGTLGVLLDVSLKVMPLPAENRTYVRRCSMPEALEQMLAWGRQPLPITATCHDGDCLWVRLSGTRQGVREAGERIGGDLLEPQLAEPFWRDQVRDQQHPFFAGALPLWRLAVPQVAPPLALPGPQWIDWGGAQRWLRSDASAATIREQAIAVGGQAHCWRGGDRAAEPFHPLSSGLATLHQGLKRAFDPQGILNPGRLYAWL